ncbi:MAG: NYN domain-containing protein [Ilumatobacteraceae bacterium]
MSADTAADVPDAVLRSALEFAVGMAAAGAKVRPLVPFPLELKRFLRFHKLPPTALSQVRAAVEGDADFRKRLGSVVTPDLVDEVGVLWLSRPDGWSEAIAALLPEQVVDGETALLREERRRRAAQEAAARARAELLSLTGELERERTAKAALAAEGDLLRTELGELRQRLREAQRAEHATAQALAKAEIGLLEARRAMPDPEQATSEPSTPEPSTPEPASPVVDTAALRDLIEGAVSASTDLVRLLNEARREVAPVVEDALPETTKPQRQRHRNPRRQPIRLPGGVLAGSIEAVEFLLRTRGVEALIDGYNVAKLGWPTLDLDQQREQCVLAAENMAKRWNMGMTVVFDGATIQGAHTSTRRRLRIVYSPAGVSADDVLRAEVNAADVGKPVVVVTNDRAIISDVTAAGANTVSSDDFLTLLRR